MLSRTALKSGKRSLLRIQPLWHQVGAPSGRYRIEKETQG